MSNHEASVLTYEQLRQAWEMMKSAPRPCDACTAQFPSKSADFVATWTEKTLAELEAGQ